MIRSLYIRAKQRGVHTSMKISDLLHELNLVPSLYTEIKDLDVTGIADNSKDVNNGYIFVANEGYQFDGHDYIPDAINNGAILVIGEKDIANLRTPYIQVDNSRKVLGIISKKFYQNPSKDKFIIGITGTNGKTTTSHLIKHILEQHGKTCSMIGTIQNTINGQHIPSYNTTPSALTINKLLSESKDEVVIMEVSSHGLTQYRMEGIEIDIGIFTNLYHEHLDYHHTMNEYFQAKLLLFDHLKDHGCAITNTNNEWGEKLVPILKERGIPTYSIGEAENSNVQLLDFLLDESLIVIKESDKSMQFTSPMPGIHNMYNTAMAYLAARKLGISSEGIIKALPSFQGVNGRFETYTQDHMPTVIVDYAHTPDAIFHCMASAKSYGAKRIIHVFGFRGNRDKTKRPQMLEITSTYSSIYILTFDDLNNVPEEDMIKNLEELQQKFGNHKGIVIPDRTLAIRHAIELADHSDWVIITGKGHEEYQQSFSLETTSDKETVNYIMKQLNEQKITN